MTDTIIDYWADVMRPWLSPLIAAPNSLTQSILPMSFLTVNETNSGSPSTEAAVVATVSYGRQIGRLVDAVEALIAERPTAVVTAQTAKAKSAFDDLREVARKVDGAKLDAAVARLRRIKDDLELVRKDAPEVFDAHRGELRAVLDRPSLAAPVS